MGMLVFVAVVGIAFLLGRRKASEPLPGESPLKVAVAAELFPPESRLPLYDPGQTFHHKDTGQKVEVVQAPEIVDGEYAIRWPSGDVGYIHQSSFEEFFE